MNQPSLLRDLIGFVVGSLLASLGVGLVYVPFFGMPDPPGAANHNGKDSAPLGVLVIFMFFAGRFIGRRGFSADFFSDLYSSVIGTYAVAVFLCVIAGVSFIQLATMIGFVTVGIAVSAAVSLLLMRWFPPRITMRANRALQ